jgi:Peptidase family M23
MTGRRFNVLAGATALALLVPAAAQAAPKRAPLFMALQRPPAPVVGTDGRRHLAYEFTLANDTGARAEVRSVTVRARGGRTLLRMSGAEVAGAMRTFGFDFSNTLERSEGGRLWLDVPLPRRGRVPRVLVNRVLVHASAANGETRDFTFAEATPVQRRARPVVVGAPLRGGPLVNFNGCCAGVSDHRGAFVAMDGRSFLSERFAIDLLQVDRQGSAVSSPDLTRNESFLTFGKPVLAVADARVISVVNDVAENVPLNEPPPITFSEREILGNHVILALGHGRYASYGHLKTGSVRVRVGQRVRRGEVLGRVGNTGPSGAPHLHFQVTDGPDPLASEGLPFVFRRFAYAGEVQNLGAFLVGAANADIRAGGHTGPRREQLPLWKSVMRFPG